MSTNFEHIYQPTAQLKVDERVYETAIEGLFYIAHEVHPDERGFYAELALVPDIVAATKVSFDVVQISQARSMTNVARGFHAESWNKLVTVMTGRALSVIADIRPDSPTFLNTERFLLGQGEGTLTGSLLITSGIGNSYCVLTGPADYLYCVDQLYRERDPGGDAAVSLFDPDLGVSWPIPQEQMILSVRDKQAKTLRELYPEKFR